MNKMSRLAYLPLVVISAAAPVMAFEVEATNDDSHPAVVVLEDRAGTCHAVKLAKGESQKIKYNKQRPSESRFEMLYVIFNSDSASPTAKVFGPTDIENIYGATSLHLKDGTVVRK